MLNVLLDVAELEGGELSVQRVPFRLPDVIREAIRSQRALASERDIELSVHGLGALPTDLVGDAGRIRQVLGHIGIPVIVGGIIPPEDADRLRAMGVAAVYTPKDFELNRIMFDIVGLVDGAQVAAE